MEEFKTYTLEELSLNKGTYGIAASAVPYDDSKLTYLRITDINDDGTLNTQSLMSVDEPNASDYLLKKNDIVFARTGNSTGRTYFYQGNECPLVYAGFLIKFSIDEKKVNPLLLKYYTHSRIYYDWVKSFDTGGTRGNINAKTYGNMPIRIPASRKTQDKIVDILSSLDEKIALNRRINDNLEQQAQALFDYYFSADSKYLSDSERGVLTNIAVYLNGLAMQKFPPTDSEHSLPVLKIKELGQGKCDNNSDRCSNDIDSNYVIDNGNIIFSWSGTLMVDVWCGGKCGLNQHLFKVTPLQDHPQWFIYYWTIRHLNTFKLIAKDKAVTMGHIKRVDLEKAEVIIPNKYSLVEMNAQIEPLYQSIINNRLQIAELETLRDALLPKLMSGELKINNLNC